MDRFIGEIILWPGSQAPRGGWLPCNGAVIPFGSPSLRKLNVPKVVELLGLQFQGNTYNGSLILPNIAPDPSGASYYISCDGTLPIPFDDSRDSVPSLYRYNDPYHDWFTLLGVAKTPSEINALDLGVAGTMMDIKLLHAPQAPTGWALCDGAPHQFAQGLSAGSYTQWLPFVATCETLNSLVYGTGPSGAPFYRNLPNLPGPVPGVNYFISFRGDFPAYLVDAVLPVLANPPAS